MAELLYMDVVDNILVIVDAQMACIGLGGIEYVGGEIDKTISIL
jgi:hypothetical protein